MIPYRYIMILYVLFRVVVALGLDFRKKRAKMPKYAISCSHKVQDLFRVAISAWRSSRYPLRVAMPQFVAQAFRVVIGEAADRTFVLVSRFQNFIVKITKYAISCSDADRAASCSDITHLPGPFSCSRVVSCSRFARQQATVSCSRVTRLSCSHFARRFRARTVSCSRRIRLSCSKVDQAEQVPFRVARVNLAQPQLEHLFYSSCSEFHGSTCPTSLHEVSRTMATRKKPNLKISRLHEKTLDNGLGMWYNESAIGQSHSGSAQKSGGIDTTSNKI